MQGERNLHFRSRLQNKNVALTFINIYTAYQDTQKDYCTNDFTWGDNINAKRI